MIHELKTWPEHFDQVWGGKKTFEKRVNDRKYNVGDVLRLRCYDPVWEGGTYDGRDIFCTVTHILKGPEMGVAEDECIMSIQDIVTHKGNSS